MGRCGGGELGCQGRGAQGLSQTPPHPVLLPVLPPPLWPTLSPPPLSSPPISSPFPRSLPVSHSSCPSPLPPNPVNHMAQRSGPMMSKVGDQVPRAGGPGWLAPLPLWQARWGGAWTAQGQAWGFLLLPFPAVGTLGPKLTAELLTAVVPRPH